MARYGILIAVLLLCAAVVPGFATAAGHPVAPAAASVAASAPTGHPAPELISRQSSPGITTPAITSHPSSIVNRQSQIANPVDPQVWADLASSRSGAVTFVIVMQETPDGGASSVVPAQMGLEQVLIFLRGRSVASFRAFYGANGIVIRGDRRAVAFLADWPDVARIESYRRDANWRRLMAAASAPAGTAATGQITGLVTRDSDGEPLSAIQVTAYRLVALDTWSVAGSATTGATGAYDIGSLPTGIYRAKFEDPAGNYVLEYYNDKRDWFYATNFDVTDGQTTPSINASLAVGGKIAGTITSATDGSGKGSILATAWRFRDGAWASEGSALSATNGSYTVGGLPSGDYRLRFANPFYPTVPDEAEWHFNVRTRDLAVDVPVVAGATTSPINAAIGMNGYIDGVVTAFDGATVADIAVTAYQFNPFLLPPAFQTISQTITGADGLYLFTLLGGVYRVGFSDTLGPLLPEYYNDKAALENGDNVPVSADGNPTSGIDAVLDAPVTSGEIPLEAGWNLVSSLLHPVNPALPSFLTGIAGSYSLVYANNGCQPAAPWSKYDPAAPAYANNLGALTVKQGWWVRMTSPATLAVSGRAPIRTQIALCTGWNLIGYPSATPRPVADALAGIAGKYNLVQAYVASDAADPWKEYNPANPGAADLTEMQPWRGYWIRMAQAATLTVENR
jgi:hypothetical protein